MRCHTTLPPVTPSGCKRHNTALILSQEYRVDCHSFYLSLPRVQNGRVIAQNAKPIQETYQMIPQLNSDANLSTAQIHPLHSDPLLTIKDVSGWLQIHEATLWRWVSERKFPKGIKLGRTTRWKKSVVEQWLENQADQSEADAAHQAIEDGDDV